MKLYLVIFEDDDGHNHDQFVQADNPQEALLLWGAYREDYITEPTHVYQVTTTLDEHAPAKVLEWGTDIELVS